MTAPEAEAKIRATMGEAGRSRDPRVRTSATSPGCARPSSPSPAGASRDRRAAIDEYVVDADHYVGVGSGAFSYLDGTLYATTFSLNRYVDRVGRGLTGITGRRTFSIGDQMQERVPQRPVRHRAPEGPVAARWGGRFEDELWWALDGMKALGALTEDDEAWRLTDRGMYYWVLMMAEFFEAVNRFRETMRARIREELDEPELRHGGPLSPVVGGAGWAPPS